MVSFPPEHVIDHASRSVDEVDDFNVLIDQIDHVNAATHGIDPSNSGATNTAALQDAVDFAAAHRYPLYIPTFATPYLFAPVAHPNPAVSGWKVCIVQRGKLEVFGNPASMPELKGIPNASAWNIGAPGAPAQNRFWTNWDPFSAAGVDERLYLHHLILNGNAANNTPGVVGQRVIHGVQFWNARHVRAHDLVVKNMRGDDTGSYETFHLDAVLCQDVGYDHNVVLTDDGGETASGISVNFCDRYRLTDNTILDMKNGQGCTRFKSSRGHVGDSYAGGCGSAGFNSEHCQETEGVLVSGSATNPLDPSHSSHAYTKGQAKPNAVGFTYLFSQGGSVRSRDCIADGNTVRGVGVSGTLTGTAAASTAASAIFSTGALFDPGHKGAYVQIDAHQRVQIASVVGPTQCTTDDPHGGGPGGSIIIDTVDLVWEGDISGSPNGFQPLDSSASLKRRTTRGCNLNGTKFDNNGNDLVDAGNGTQTTVPRVSGQAPTATFSGYVSGTEFYNPFPCDMWALVSGSSGATSLRGPHPKDTPQSTGIGDGIFPLKASGAITCTGTLKLMFA